MSFVVVPISPVGGASGSKESIKIEEIVVSCSSIILSQSRHVDGLTSQDIKCDSQDTKCALTQGGPNNLHVCKRMVYLNFVVRCKVK